MRYLKSWSFIIGTIFLITFIVIEYNNDYMKDKDRKCVVINKNQTADTYKYHGNFYLILKDERGRIFDLIVSPATYSQSNIGETLILNLREMDIQQTPTKNILFFFSPIILILTSIISFLSLIFFGPSKKEEPTEEEIYNSEKTLDKINFQIIETYVRKKKLKKLRR